jgi:hypothetical protein
MLDAQLTATIRYLFLFLKEELDAQLAAAIRYIFPHFFSPQRVSGAGSAAGGGHQVCLVV